MNSQLSGASTSNFAKFEDNMPEEIKESITSSANNQSDELVKLLRLSLEKNEEILKISRDIKSYMRWQNIWGTLRLLLILGPIILGFIYLPPLIDQYLESYKSLLQ